MESGNSLLDEAAFEELFKNRFTENDEKYMEIKLKSSYLPPPVVHPWKLPGRIFNKKWDYQDRNRSRQDGDRNRSNYDRSYRDRSGERNWKDDKERSRDSSSSHRYDNRRRDKDYDRNKGHNHY